MRESSSGGKVSERREEENKRVLGRLAHEGKKIEKRKLETLIRDAFPRRVREA